MTESKADFNKTLKDDDERESLGRSMAKEFSRENLDFMTACFNFQTLSRDGLLEHPAHRHNYLKGIVQAFVGQQATGQINLKDVTELGLLLEWRDVDRDASHEEKCDYRFLFVMLDSAIDEVNALVSKDTYQRHILQFPEAPQARKASFADRVSAGAARFSDKARQKIRPSNPPPKEGSDRWVPPFATKQMKEWATPILLRRRQELLGPGPDEEIKGTPPTRDVRDEIRALLTELHFDSLVQPQAYSLNPPVGAAALNSGPSIASSSTDRAAAVSSPRDIPGTFDSLMFHCEQFVDACNRNLSSGVKRSWARAIQSDFEVQHPQFSCDGPLKDHLLNALAEWLEDKVTDHGELVAVVREVTQTAEPRDSDD